MIPTPLSIGTAFELLYGHPPETCPHCFKPKHREPCEKQLKYERAMNGDEIDEQRRTEDREAGRREDSECIGASDGSVDWEHA